MGINMTNLYIDKDGNYLGNFCDKNIPEYGIVVGEHPLDARQKYKNGLWQPLELEYLNNDKLVELCKIVNDEKELYATVNGIALDDVEQSVVNEKISIRGELNNAV